MDVKANHLNKSGGCTAAAAFFAYSSMSRQLEHQVSAQQNDGNQNNDD